MTVSDFALQLKTETKKSHTAAENTKFVGSFLRGVVSKESYKKCRGIGEYLVTPMVI